MIAIVTDSSAYLTLEECRAMGVTVVPLTYALGEDSAISELCVDQNGDYETFVLRNLTNIKTSQASYQMFYQTFRRLVARGFDVLCLTISGRLSGTYGNARMAAQELAHEVTQTSARDMVRERVQVIDSKSVGAGLYLLVRAADAMVRAGVALPMIAHRLRGLRDQLRTAFSVDDITPLRKSGRLGGMKLSISTILNLKPMLGFQDGALVALGTARGRQEQIRLLLEALPDDADTYVVEGFCADDAVRRLREALESRGKTVLLRRLGPVLAAHLGAGCVGVAVCSPSKRAAD